jgi:hypothetical protein
MNSKSHTTRYGCVLGALTILAGCSGGSAPPFLPAGASSPNDPGVNPNARSIRQPAAKRGSETAGGYVYVSNRTEQGSSQLLVYKEGVPNPAPIRTISKQLVDAGGIAVDSAGDVFVANGSGGNVLEYGPGGSPLVDTYSTWLVHPTDVAVANGTLYVADQGNANNGYSQQIFEFPLTNTGSQTGIAGIGAPSQLNEGVAVNPSGASGTFFATSSTLSALPFAGGCSGSAYTVAENILPTLWMTVPLSNNQQAWGLAFDSQGNMYASDPCSNAIDIYSQVAYAWTYSRKVPGTFNAPLFLTIDGSLLAIPSSGSTQAPESGYVTVIDLTDSATVTITSHLEHPVGAAATAGS